MRIYLQTIRYLTWSTITLIDMNRRRIEIDYTLIVWEIIQINFSHQSSVSIEIYLNETKFVSNNLRRRYVNELWQHLNCCSFVSNSKIDVPYDPPWREDRYWNNYYREESLKSFLAYRQIFYLEKEIRHSLELCVFRKNSNIRKERWRMNDIRL